jgi:hypothetical protein
MLDTRSPRPISHLTHLAAVTKHRGASCLDYPAKWFETKPTVVGPSTWGAQDEDGPVQQTDRTSSFDLKLLVFLLAFFGGLCAGARRFGFGFLLPRVTLGVGFILLRLALSNYIVAAGDGSAHLFSLTFNTLNGALDRFLWSALLIAHETTSLSVVAELALIWMRIGLVSCWLINASAYTGFPRRSRPNAPTTSPVVLPGELVGVLNHSRATTGFVWTAFSGVQHRTRGTKEK